MFASGMGVSGRETGESAFRLSSEKGNWGLPLPFYGLIQQRSHWLWADMTCIGSLRSFPEACFPGNLGSIHSPPPCINEFEHTSILSLCLCSSLH